MDLPINIKLLIASDIHLISSKLTYVSGESEIKKIIPEEARLP